MKSLSQFLFIRVPPIRALIPTYMNLFGHNWIHLQINYPIYRRLLSSCRRHHKFNSVQGTRIWGPNFILVNIPLFVASFLPFRSCKLLLLNRINESENIGGKFNKFAVLSLLSKFQYLFGFNFYSAKAFLGRVRTPDDATSCTTLSLKVICEYWESQNVLVFKCMQFTILFMKFVFLVLLLRFLGEDVVNSRSYPPPPTTSFLWIFHCLSSTTITKPTRM